MEKIDVLMINLSIIESEMAMMPPLGQMYIATVLKKNGYKVKILDLAVEKNKLEIVYQMICKYDPKIVGLSSYYETWNQMYNVAELIKRVNKDIVACVGGNGATFSYEEIMNNENIDYVIRFEGEYSFLQLCEYVMKSSGSLDCISGLVYRWKKQICINQESRITTLDELPFPDRELIDLKKYIYPFTIITSRGCAGNCIFCSSKAFWNKKVRFRSIDNVVEELREIKQKYDADTFFLLDDNFTLNSKRVSEFCQLLINEKMNFKWFCETRADCLKKSILQEMYDSGCRWLQIGLESGNDNVLKNIGKNLKYEQIEKAIKEAYLLGFKIKISAILGHHMDDDSTINETIQKVEYLKTEYGAEIAWSVNTPFPGTDLYIQREKYGIDILTNSWNNYRMDNPIINTKFLRVNDLRKYLAMVEGRNGDEGIYKA